MYRKENQYQMTFSDQFFNPKDDPISDDHIYMKIVNLLDWNTLLNQFTPFYSNIGRGSIPIKNKIILHIVKHLTGDSDDLLVERIGTDMALQKALNISFIEAQATVKYIEKDKTRIRKIKGYIDPSSLSKFRKRIGIEGVKLLEEQVNELLNKHKLIRSKTVLVDTTVSPSNISYPTDMSLLYYAHKYLLKQIKKFSSKKVRTQRRTVKKLFLSFIKIKSKNRANIKPVHGQMIQYVHRNLTQAKKAFERTSIQLQQSSRNKLKEKLSTIELFLEQQKEIHKQTSPDGCKKGIQIKNRIVSLFKPHVRAIPRGKVNKPVEFGAKILYEARDSFVTVLHIAFDNMADTEMLKQHFPRWKGLILGGDRGFHSKENTSLAEENELKGYYVEKKGKNKGVASWAKKRVRKKRAGIEAKFSLLKRKYGLNKNLYNRGKEGETQWILSSAIAHNLSRACSLI